MRKFLWLSAFLLCFAVSMFGQGARFNGVVTDQTGRPVAAATVYICELTATGTPCSPHASIFSDVGLTTPMANPITTDNFGRYGFWISPGSYLQQLSGFGINTYTQPITVGGGGGAGCTPTGPLDAVQTNTPEGTCYGSSDFLYDDTNDNLTAGDTPFALPIGTTNSVVIGDTNYIDQPTAYNYVFGQGNSVYGNTGYCMVVGIDVDEGCYWFEAPTQGAFFGYNDGGLQVVPSDNGAPYANTSIVQSLNPYGTNLPQPANLVCTSPQDSTAQACSTSPTNWIGISEDGIQTVSTGMALLVVDNTATVGDSVCTSSSSAGQGHDSGGTTPCPGGTQVGWVMSVTSNGATTSEPMVLIDGSKVAGGGGGTPNAGTPILYASYYGNDSNDGLTWATPKADIMAAYDALPSSGGYIYITDGGAGKPIPACKATDPVGCGIWLMPSTDPNYAALSPGLTLSSVSVAGPTVTYTGTITPYATLTTLTATQYFNISGFSNAGNNGTSIHCTSATSTTLVCTNATAVNESHSATATLAGWRKERQGVVIVGAGSSGDASFALGGQTNVKAGSATDPTLPEFWMSGAPGITVKNVNFGTGCLPAVLGFFSTGLVTNSGIVNLKFQNDYFYVAHTAGCGPGILLGGDSFWNFIEDSQISGNPVEALAITSVARSSNVVTVTTTLNLPVSWANGLVVGLVGIADSSFDGGNFTITVTGANTFTYPQNGPDATSTGGEATSDAAQAIVSGPFDGTIPPGLTFVKNLFMDIGGIKVYSGSAGGTGLYAENILQEAGASPAVWNAYCHSYLLETLDNIVVADAYTNYAAVRSDCSNQYGNDLVVRNVETVDGPATVMGGSLPSDPTQSPILNNQHGLVNGYLLGQNDSSRRGFAPSASLYTNLVTSPGPYSCTSGIRTCTPGTAPDGTSNATLMSATGTSSYNFYDGSSSVAAGDIFICAGWYKSLNPPNGYPGQGTNPTNCLITTGTVDEQWRIGNGSIMPGAGEWDWIWTAFKISYTSASTGTLVYASNIYLNQGVGVYAPIVLRIPAGTIVDNEAAAYAQALQTFRHDATPGQISTLPGQQFVADSILAKVSISTPALTISGIAGTGCLQISSGVVSGTGASCGSAPGGTNIFDSFQFAANSPITSAGNYLQLTYDSTLTSTYTGSGTSGDPYIATLKLPATAVSAGSYTFGGFTVDAHGRLTAAASSSMQTNDTPLASQTFFDVLDSSADSIGLHLAWTNTTTGKIQGEITGTIAAAALPVTGSGTLGGVPDFAAGTHKVMKSVTASVWADVQLSDTDLKGTTAGAIPYVVSSAIAELATTPYSAMVSGATNPAWATPTGNGQCLMSGPSSYATTTPSFQTCPGTISFPQTVAGTTHSGGIPYFSSGTVLTSSAALTANQLVLGGGAGASPFSIGSLGTTTTVYHGNASGAGSFGSVVNGDLGAQAVSSGKMTTELTYYSCDMAFGNTNASAVLANGDLGPQKDMCLIPKAATVLEVDVSADTGAPSIIVGRNHSLTIANLLSGALATASSGGRACSNTGGTASPFWSGVTCSSTLQNTSLSNGDTIQAVSGTAGGTAKYMDVHIIYATVN